MKPFSSNEGSGDKLEKSKVRQDLKEVMDRQCSLTGDTGTTSERKGNPLQDFFIDEIELTKKLLHIVRTDIDASSFEDNEVRQISILRTILLYNYFSTTIIIIIYENNRYL